MTEPPIAPDEVHRAVELARGHDHRASLGALAFDVVSRMGQARTLFAGREFVEARAAEHGVGREQAATRAGNLLTVLERGPGTPAERALLAAFAVEGLAGRLDEGAGEGRDAILARFVDHADWLSLSTTLSLYPFARARLAPAELDALWGAVVDAAVADAAPTPPGRARNAARLTVLADAMTDGAQAAIGRIAAEVSDPVVAWWARSLAGDRLATEGPGAGAGNEGGASPPDGVRVRGRLGRAPRGSVRELLRVVTGIAVVAWLGRGLALLVGLRREAELTLAADAVRIHRRTRLLGRTVREGDQTFALSAVAGAGRLVRYPMLHLLVGLCALSAGVLLGGFWLIEGIESGTPMLVVVAAGVVLVGAGLDLGLSVLVPGRQGRVAFDLRVMSGTGVRLVRVAADEADRFLEALSGRLGGA